MKSNTDRLAVGGPSGALTVLEAAEYLRLSRASLYRLFKAGSLKPSRIGGRVLIRRVDADALLERGLSETVSVVGSAAGGRDGG